MRVTSAAVSPLLALGGKNRGSTLAGMPPSVVASIPRCGRGLQVNEHCPAGQGRRLLGRVLHVGVRQPHAVDEDLVRADRDGSLVAPGRPHRDVLLRGLVVVVHRRVEAVEAVGLDPNPAHQEAVLVDRQAARIAGQPERQGMCRHIRAWKLGELHPEQVTAGLAGDRRRDVLLDDEPRGTGGEGVAIRRQVGRRARLRDRRRPAPRGNVYLPIRRDRRLCSRSGCQSALRS